MFKRIDFNDWNTLLIVVFFITLWAFLYFSWKAIRMKSSERDHLANLPLDKDITDEPKADSKL